MSLEEQIAKVEEFLLSKGLITEKDREEFNRNWEVLKGHLDD